MPSSYTVEAILKARDSGFSSAFKNAEKSVSGLTSMAGKVGSVFKSVLGANLISSALTSGIGALTSGVSSMVGELNSSQKAWKTFEGNLQAFGRSTEEITKAKTEMQDFATKTIYSASDMASTYSQLDAVGTKNVGSLVKAFGGLAASAENPAQAMKSLSTQATQMASKPKVAWMDFKIMMEQAPAGMAAVAKEMGMSTSELVSAVQDGKVNTEEFFDAMNRAGNSDAFQKMATEFKTVDQAIDGMKESLSNKLMPAFEHLNKFGIKAVNALSDALEKINFDKFAKNLGDFLGKIDVSKGIANIQKAFSTVFNPILITKFNLALASVKGAINSIGQAFQSAGNSTSILLTISNVIGAILNTVSAGAQIVQKFMTSFANTGAVKALKGAFDSLVAAYNNIVTSVAETSAWSTLGTVIGNVVKVIAQVVQVIADFIANLDPNIVKGFTNALVSGIAGFLAFSTGAKLVSKGVRGLNFIKSFNPFNFFRKNAEDGTTGAIEAVTQSKSKLAQVLESIASVIKSVGVSIGVAAKGIGTGLSNAFIGLGTALKAAGPANIIAFGAAVATAAVGIGAGIAIIAAGFALLATQSSGVATILNAVGQAFATVATAIIGAFANAIVRVSGVLPVVTSALAKLSPLIVAVGQAFGAAAPAITALGNAIAQIATAVTPIVEIIGNVFTQCVQIVSQAIVQIVQALAPFMPAVTEMVQAIAPVLQDLVSAFNNLVSQISPIINSITNLFKTLGEQIRNILDGAKGVIESFGGAVRNILDGIAGIFDSIGNAALNAGKGFKELAKGVVMITNTNLADMAASLAAVAVGVGKITAQSGGMASAGAGIKSLGQGLVMVQASGTAAASVLQTLASAVPAISSSITGLAPAMMQTSAAMTAFAGGAIASLVGLSVASSLVTAFNVSLTMLYSAITNAGGAIIAFGSNVTMMLTTMSNIAGSAYQVATAIYKMQTAMYQTSSATLSVGQALSSLRAITAGSMSGMVSIIGASMVQAVSIMRSSMQQMVSVVRQSATQMTQAGQQAGRGVSNGVTNGIRSGVGSAIAATSAMVNAIRSTAMAGVGSMRYIGAMIGQGLAAGMYSALGSVTAAANALVAQAERAAQAKAKIHSPSRLFRDEVGLFIGQGVAVGIDRSTKFVAKSMDNMFDGIEQFSVQVSDMMSDNLAYSFDTGRYSSSVEMTYRKQDSEQAGIIKESLAIIKELASRDTVIKVNSREFARVTGDDITDYQNGRQRLENLVWGIKDNV